MFRVGEGHGSCWDPSENGGSIQLLVKSMAPEHIRQALRQLRQEAGLSMEKMAKLIGRKSASSWQHYEDRFKKDRLPSEIAEKLADALESRGLDRDKILALAGIETQPARHRLVRNSVAADGAKDLPLYGRARGGSPHSERIVVNPRDPIEFIARPPELAHVQEAFAVEVQDESMLPAFRPGHFAFVNPNKAVTRGCDALIVFEDGDAIIKSYQGQKGSELLLRQYNPPRDVRIPVADVQQILRIIGVREP